MNKGCKYCAEELEGNGTEDIMCGELTNLNNSQDTFAVFVNRGLLSCLFDCAYYETRKHTKINYCPMCGANLNELYKDEE